MPYSSLSTGGARVDRRDNRDCIIDQRAGKQCACQQAIKLAEQLAPESPLCEAAPATSAVLPAAPGNLPLLMWVLGMTCLLMLRWERRLPGADGLGGAAGQ